MEWRSFAWCIAPQGSSGYARRVPEGNNRLKRGRDRFAIEDRIRPHGQTPRRRARGEISSEARRRARQGRRPLHKLPAAKIPIRPLHRRCFGVGVLHGMQFPPRDDLEDRQHRLAGGWLGGEVGLLLGQRLLDLMPAMLPRIRFFIRVMEDSGRAVAHEAQHFEDSVIRRQQPEGQQELRNQGTSRAHERQSPQLAYRAQADSNFPTNHCCSASRVEGVSMGATSVFSRVAPPSDPRTLGE